MSMITVSQLNRHISELVSGDRELKGFMLRAEIAQVDLFRAANGTMLFLTLKDEQSEIKANLYSGVLSRLKFRPEKGMSVIVMGSVSVYEKRGTYSVTIMDMAADGAGLAAAALDELKKKLAKEGFFSEEHKRPLPYMPKKIGVVTSLTGAVVHDITDTLTTRYPLCEVYAVHCQVQGAGAPESIVRGIMRAESAGCDVIIVGRGGGSDEELSVFNDERIARAVYNCLVPVVSAVGHEQNHTIIDDVADRYVSTPTRAAIAVSPDISEIMRNVSVYSEHLGKAMNNIIGNAERSFQLAQAKLAANSPENRLKLAEERINSMENRLGSAVERKLQSLDSSLERCIAVLEGRSPLKIMEAGYSLAYKGESLIKDSAETECGDIITLRFAKGGAEAEIKKKW
ncbi:exodeoxyribonuclease VII large subunit [Ruminococcus sp. XPD3002]|uniref:exodeoxyribonuclease VII large subunit n=1 Tax=Ruminococcus sp. XPD3002 TaxID=1452269 RepID=UPI00090FE5A0|nr:Exodeoxyribonuclease VII large subunit [Ruminococcus flavefaciens]